MPKKVQTTIDVVLIPFENPPYNLPSIGHIHKELPTEGDRFICNFQVYDLEKALSERGIVKAYVHWFALLHYDASGEMIQVSEGDHIGSFTECKVNKMYPATYQGPTLELMSEVLYLRQTGLPPHRLLFVERGIENEECFNACMDALKQQEYKVQVHDVV
jgi:hypothetical protein